MKRINDDEMKLSASQESLGMKRRDFLKLLGSGIFIFFTPWDQSELLELQAQQGRSLPTEFNSFLQIAEDGTVKCFTGKIEMGQGAITSLAQIMADELELPFDRVKMIMGDTDLCPWDGGTHGSQTTRSLSPHMRVAAAEAKAVLMNLGSEYLHLPLSRLEVKEGIISDVQNSNSKVSYGELTKGKKIEKHLDSEPILKDYRKFNFVGNSYLRVDSRLKVTGEARFSADYQFPGLLHLCASL